MISGSFTKKVEAYLIGKDNYSNPNKRMYKKMATTKTPPDVTSKNTKNEILSAYNEMLETIKNQKQPVKQEEIKKEEEKNIVKSATKNSVDSIVREMAELKIKISKSFDELEDKLVTEYKKLTELQQAIDIEKKSLEEIHEIKVQADSLTALILAQKEERAAFELEITEQSQALEKEIAEKKAQWQKEQTDFDLAKKENDIQLKKERQRETEEYNYNLKLTRKKEEDAYAANKAIIEKELAEKQAETEKALADRETALSGKENEYAELKAKVDAFPAELEKELANTKKSVTETMQLKYTHESTLNTAEIEGERKLTKQTIDSLEAKIKEQDARIRELTQKTNEAGVQVQSIALKALEGTSSQRSFVGKNENITDTSK